MQLQTKPKDVSDLLPTVKRMSTVTHDLAGEHQRDAGGRDSAQVDLRLRHHEQCASKDALFVDSQLDWRPQTFVVRCELQTCTVYL